MLDKAVCKTKGLIVDNDVFDLPVPCVGLGVDNYRNWVVSGQLCEHVFCVWSMRSLCDLT